MLSRLIFLIRKELQSMLSTAPGRMILIVPVILQTAIFPFAATMEVHNATLAIYNQDAGRQSRELIERLSHTPAFGKILPVYNEAALQQSIDNREALLALRIAPNFSKQALADRGGSLQIIVDGRRSNSGQIAQGYILAMASSLNGHDPYPVLRNLFNPNLHFYWHIIPSLVAIITTIGCLMVTALSVAREREQGTFDQLLVSPLTPAWIMAGKAIPGIMIAMVQGAFIAAVAHWLYRVPFTGNVLLLFAGMLMYGLALAGVGLFISSLSRTQQQAFLGVFAFMVPAVILSGYVSPIENMPLTLQWLANANPLTYFIRILKGVFLKGFGARDAWINLWPMALIALITLSLALRLLRRHVA